MSYYLSLVRRTVLEHNNYVTLLPGDLLKDISEFYISDRVHMIVVDGKRVGHQHYLRKSEFRPASPMEVLARQAQD